MILNNNFSFDPKDLRIESWEEGWLDGGLHVGIPRGVKVTHVPSGMQVSYDKSRSQHENRTEAFKLLSEKINDANPH